MTRLISFLVLGALCAAPAIAATYSAKPATAPAAKRVIARDISWTCGPDACRGSTESSRPIVLCQDLARRAGRIEQFESDGRALTAAELGKCNAAAAPAGASVQANAQ